MKTVLIVGWREECVLRRDGFVKDGGGGIGGHFGSFPGLCCLLLLAMYLDHPFRGGRRKGEKG